MRRLAIVLAGLVVAVAVAAGIGALWLRHALSPRDESAPPIVLTIARGSTLARVARELEQAGVVRSAHATELVGRWHHLDVRLQAGEYELSPAVTALAVLQQIADGRVRTFELVIPEGFDAQQIAARIEESGLGDAATFLALARSPAAPAVFGVAGPSLEGYLFPATYRLPRGLGADELATAMVGRFLESWQPLAAEAASRSLGMREIVTLASIVEKETGAPEERPLVASVYLNRLAIGMKLDADPTVIYGIHDFDGNLTRAHLEDGSNPWNTYRRAGLPPGPIASPGEASLRAVLQPAKSDALYFVARGDGTHVFSRTLAEHLHAVREHQMRRRAGARSH